MGTEQLLENNQTLVAAEDTINRGNRSATATMNESLTEALSAMTIDEFWAIIKESKQYSDRSISQASYLGYLLDELSPEQMQVFYGHWHDMHNAAYRWDLWAVLTIIDDGSSDSTFDHFRFWLIGQGKKVFESVIANPESLIKHVKRNTDLSGEDLAQVVFKKSLRDTEDDDCDDKVKKATVRWEDYQPAGTKWTAKDLPRLYPALCIKMGVTEHSFS
jgi:hypothetical protein